jgi:ribosomal protein L44E
MGVGLGRRRLGSLVVREKKRLVISLLHQKTYHKNAYVPKPNPLLNKLDTNPDPPIFPHSTNDFQKPIKFISTSGKVFFEKESEKPSEEKPVEKPSGEKPSKSKAVKFHCDTCGRDGHKSEFCFKRKREERMAKEWANKDKYHPPNGVLEPCVQMHRAKASVRTISAWGEQMLQKVLPEE